MLPRCSAVLLACVSLVTGCAVGPNYRTPKVPTPGGYAESIDAPAGASASAGGTSGAAADLTSWWHALNDPELDSLIERAIAGNPDLIMTLDRLHTAADFDAPFARSAQ